MFQLEAHGSFILLALIFGLLAETVFLINRLIDRNKQKELWNLKADEINTAEKIISYLLIHLYLCVAIAALLIIRIGAHGFSYTNLGVIDFIIVFSFLILLIFTATISLISYKIRWKHIFALFKKS